jgi:putative PEP-CTERM system TPR-repeat lipoprotein
VQGIPSGIIVAEEIPHAMADRPTKESRMPRHPNKLKLTAALLSGAFLVAGLSACNRTTQSTESLLGDAKQYEQKGDRKAALIQLKNAVEKSPDNGEARLALGDLELTMGDAVSAEKEFRKARSLGIPADRVLPSLGKALVQQGKIKDVLTDVTPEAAAKSAPLLVLRGNALLSSGKADEAKQAYDQALALNPNSGEAFIGLAQHAMVGNDRDSADRYAQEAVAKDPKNPEVYMYRGTMLRAQGKNDEALAAYDKALALDPNNRNVHVEKAYVQITRGKFPEAKAEIEAADKASPGNLLVTYTRALYEFSQGHFAPANESLQKILKVAPDHLPSILLAGASEMNLGLLQQADQHLRKYLESNPNDGYARKLLAQNQLKSSEPAAAAATLAPLMKDATQDPQLLALAGESSMQIRDFGKASSYFEKAAALAPKAAPLRTSLGLSKLAQGDQAGALSELQLATSLDPKSTQATIALVQTELNLKHYDKALAAVQAQEKQQPDNVNIQNLKGAVYMVMGDHANARAAFAKAATLQPTFTPAAVNLARLDMQEGKPDAAKQRFMAVLAADKNNVSAMNALGELALAQAHPDEATSWFEKASAVSPDALAPALRLGRHYLQTRQPEKALTLARKYQPANPTNPDLLELVGQAQIATKDVPGALETYSKLASVLPKSPAPQLRLAGVHMLMKNDSAAKADLKRAIELQPDFVPARMAQVEMAMHAGQPQEALDLARQMQTAGDKTGVGYALEGDVQMAQKKPELAVPAYEKALALSKSPDAMLKVIQALSLSGKAKEAQARANGWLKDHPGDLRMGMFVAETELAAKDFKGAIVVLESMLKANPNEPATLNNLAWAYQQEKDPRAMATAELAYKLDANNPAIMDTLGWMLAEQNNAARAVPLLQKATGLAPKATEIRYHLAVALQKSGDKQGARKELNALLSANTPFPQQEQARALLNTL